jgi:hypothetical protein
MKKLNKIRKTVFKDFSVKKLLLTILCTIIVTTFIGFTILFVNDGLAYPYYEVLKLKIYLGSVFSIIVTPDFYAIIFYIQTFHDFTRFYIINRFITPLYF